MSDDYRNAANQWNKQLPSRPISAMSADFRNVWRLPQCGKSVEQMPM
jgi:hypothetical protein